MILIVILNGLCGGLCLLITDSTDRDVHIVDGVFDIIPAVLLPDFTFMDCDRSHHRTLEFFCGKGSPDIVLHSQPFIACRIVKCLEILLSVKLSVGLKSFYLPQKFGRIVPELAQDILVCHQNIPLFHSLLDQCFIHQLFP